MFQVDETSVFNVTYLEILVDQPHEEKIQHAAFPSVLVS